MASMVFVVPASEAKATDNSNLSGSTELQQRRGRLYEQRRRDQRRYNRAQQSPDANRLSFDISSARLQIVSLHIPHHISSQRSRYAQTRQPHAGSIIYLKSSGNLLSPLAFNSPLYSFYTPLHYSTYLYKSRANFSLNRCV